MDKDGRMTEEICGSAITAEEKRKKLANGTVNKHHYYHCSRTTGQRAQKDKGHLLSIGRQRVSYTESEIEMLFEVVFRPLHFTDEVCKWMQDILLKEHAEKSGDHRQQLSAHQARHKMLENYIDRGPMKIN